MANMFDNYGGGDSDTLPQQSQQPPVLPGTNPFSAAPTVGQAVPGAGQTPPMPATGDSIIQQLLAKINGGAGGTGLADTGSLLGAFSSGQKDDRIVKGNFTQNYDRLMMDAQTGRNQNESDAMKKLAQTSYLKTGGYQPGTHSIQMNGQTRDLPSFGGGPRPASAEQQQGAGTLQKMLLDRLRPGGSYLPQPLDGYATPGTAEKVGSYGAVGAAGGSVLNDVLNGAKTSAGPSATDSILKMIMAKYAPAAGN